jgi:threonine/homoserine/homoserine lactone efflux protein
MYLLYIAYQLLRAKRESLSEIATTTNTTIFAAFREGFVTNVLNPKATIFFLSVFTQVINPETSILTQALYGMMMASIVGTWFLILTTIINFPLVKSHIASVQYYLNKVM